MIEQESKPEDENTEVPAVKPRFARLGQMFSAKLLRIFILVLLFLIPILLVGSLVAERKNRSETVNREVSESWGGTLKFAGPILALPYLSPSGLKEQILFYPSDLQVAGALDSFVKSRGIYQAAVYNAELQVSGHFDLADQLRLQEKKLASKQQNKELGEWLWEEAALVYSFADLKGLQSVSSAQWDGLDLKLRPDSFVSVRHLSGYASMQVGAELNSLAPNSWQLGIDKRSISFSLDFRYNGGMAIHLLPIGKNTKIKLQSNWPGPSFQGAFLPLESSVEKEQRDKLGFTALWEISPYQHNVAESLQNPQGSEVIVALLPLLSPYQMVQRTLNYSFLFLMLPFFTILLFEILLRKRVHIIQYFFVGMANIVFYLLLLSLSEHYHFGLSYLIAASVTTILVSLYAAASIAAWRRSWIITAVLGSCYIANFVIIQAEDYALLMGSVLLFAILGLAMFFTRKIDWYASGTSPEGSSKVEAPSPAERS